MSKTSPTASFIARSRSHGSLISSSSDGYPSSAKSRIDLDIFDASPPYPSFLASSSSMAFLRIKMPLLDVHDVHDDDGDDGDGDDDARENRRVVAR